MANIGYSKVFLLDKYFSELQKFWDPIPEKTDGQQLAAAAAMMLMQQQRRTRSRAGSASAAGTVQSVHSEPIQSTTKRRDSYGSKPLPKPPDYVNQIIAEPVDDVEDLVRCKGPLTEDLVIRCLRRRLDQGHVHVQLGPILLLMNKFTKPASLAPNPPSSRGLSSLVKRTLRQLIDSGCPQTLILSGFSGSGKTHNMMLIVKHLFESGGYGEAYKHLMASLTVIKAMGSAKTRTNRESSRIGHYIDIQVTDKVLTRGRVHCYFLDHSRLVNRHRSPFESNYRIFYQLLAGLTDEERSGLFLTNHSIRTLSYLGGPVPTELEIDEDKKRFNEWRTCLGMLGIPFGEVVRVLAAVLLLGNVEFSPNGGDGGGEVEWSKEATNLLYQASSLLGISSPSLKTALTTRTTSPNGFRNPPPSATHHHQHPHHPQQHLMMIHSRCDTQSSLSTLNALTKALYCRTFATIVRRANSLRRQGTFSSDSTEIMDAMSYNASTMGTAGSKASKSMTALNNAVRRVTDNSIGVLDLYGFEEGDPSQLEQLCINLSAETMQHFYNTHIFKGSLDACSEEGIETLEIDYADNVPCIDLISSLRTGLLSMLDVECSIPNATIENYVQKVQLHHINNPRIELDDISRRSFTVQHFAGKVCYDVTDFPETNRDILPDDVVAIFHKHHCSFGFASHLFTAELKILGAGGLEPSPKGINFRISPSHSSSTELLNGHSEPISTLTQDFHTRLDNLLRTLVHAKPHFIRCIKLNTGGGGGVERSRHNSSNNHHNHVVGDDFDRRFITQQIRAFQIVETLNLMSNGLPHRLRLRAFLGRYRGGVVQDLQGECVRFMESSMSASSSNVDNTGDADGRGNGWKVGRKHVFFNELTSQLLESQRLTRRQNAAIKIQARWRGWSVRRKRLNTNLAQSKTAVVSMASIIPSTRRPQPISGTPPLIKEGGSNGGADASAQLVEKTCELFGLDMEKPPLLPPSRSYTVKGGNKFGYPQLRVMRLPFPDETTAILQRKELVNVVGISSSRRGHLVVEKKGTPVHVPFQYLEFGNSVKEGVK